MPTSGGAGALYTVRYRHYDPELGRWLERDPLGYVDGMSLYEYVAGNPGGFVDPFGLCIGGWIDWLTGKEDKKWKEMMEENHRLAKKKLAEQVKNGVTTQAAADKIIGAMEDALADTMEEVGQILSDARKQIYVTAAALILLPAGGAVVVRVVQVVRAGAFAPGFVWVGYGKGTFVYRVGATGWRLGWQGNTLKGGAPWVAIPIPVINTGAVPVYYGAVAGRTCLGSACRAVARGWGL